MVAEIDAFNGAHIGPSGYSDYIVLRPTTPLTDEQVRRMYVWCAEKIGSQYDWAEIFDYVLRYFRGIHACLDQRKRYICTEFVLEAYRAAGIELTSICDALAPAELEYLPTLERVDELSEAV
jgi:hypothetical protein